MRYLIIADMHGNWDALTTVLEAADQTGYDEALVLGDLVGYGASPNEIIEELQQLERPFHVIRGNHDKVVAGIDNGLNFNPTALAAARWTSASLTPENLDYVRQLPQGPIKVAPEIVICHGSVVDEDEYLLSGGGALDSFEAHDSNLTFFGHTHIPSLFSLRDDMIEVSVLEGDRIELELDPTIRYMINPGSVGQPRDRDPRTAYVLYDADRRELELNRLEYPIEEAQERIRAADLPEILAERLSVGI
jgi:predicted phosphodiesterase